MTKELNCCTEEMLGNCPFTCNRRTGQSVNFKHCRGGYEQRTTIKSARFWWPGEMPCMLLGVIPNQTQKVLSFILAIGSSTEIGIPGYQVTTSYSKARTYSGLLLEWMQQGVIHFATSCANSKFMQHENCAVSHTQNQCQTFFIKSTYWYILRRHTVYSILNTFHMDKREVYADSGPKSEYVTNLISRPGP